MRALRPTCLVLAALAFGASAGVAQECEDERTLADRFWTLAIGASIEGDATSDGGRDQTIAGGVLMPFGCGGRWVARTDLTTGFRSTPVAFFDSFFAGLDLGLARAFGAPRIELGENTQIEWYLLAGGGGYWVHGVPEAAGGSAWVADMATGIGVRASPISGAGSLIFVELLRKERFDQWDDRWYMRWSLTWPM